MTLERIYFRAAYATALALLVGFGALCAYSSYEAWKSGWAASHATTAWLHQGKACVSIGDPAEKEWCNTQMEVARSLAQDADRYWAFALQKRNDHIVYVATLPLIPLILFYIGRWAATNRVRPIIPR